MGIEKVNTDSVGSKATKTFYQKEIPVVDEYDVVVCGGGPSGIGAAVVAAENGAKTLLIERFGFLGGMATAGLVNPMSEFAYNSERVVGGVAWRFAKKLESAGGALIEYPRCNVSFNPELYKLEAQRMVIESGCELKTNTLVVDCIRADGVIKEVIIADKDGLKSIRGKYFIDATGEGYLASLSGVEMLPITRAVQPATLCFTMSNVDTNTKRMHIIHQKNQGFNHHATFIRDALFALREKGVNVPQFGGPWLCTTLKEGVITLNLTRAEVAESGAESFNNAERKMLEDLFILADLIIKNVEEFKNAYVSAVATSAGIRQSRRIKGVHVLTGEEYVSGNKHESSIARSCHAIDIHLPKDEGQILKFPPQAGYIPYDSMISIKVDNLITLGRAISADEEAFAATRVQAPCMEMGQAAGFAVNLCLKNGNIPVWAIDRKELVEKVKNAGSFV